MLKQNFHVKRYGYKIYPTITAEISFIYLNYAPKTLLAILCDRITKGLVIKATRKEMTKSELIFHANRESQYRSNGL